MFVIKIEMNLQKNLMFRLADFLPNQVVENKLLEQSKQDAE